MAFRRVRRKITILFDQNMNLSGAGMVALWIKASAAKPDDDVDLFPRNHIVTRTESQKLS